jgi:uracil permease
MKDQSSLSPSKQIIVGVQFLFVAFGATVLVPLLVGIDPSIALFSAGVGIIKLIPIFVGIIAGYILYMILGKVVY